MNATLRRSAVAYFARGSGGPLAVYLALALLVMGPLLQGGYILALDMVFGPYAPSPNDLFYGFDAPVLGAKHLPDLIASALDTVLPMSIVQKAYMLAVMVIAGLGVHRLVPVKRIAPRYYAGVLFAFNPFVYVRFLAGQWYVLMAYAFIPWALYAFVRFVKAPGILRGALAALLVSCTAVNSHMFAVTAFACFVTYVALAVRGKLGRKSHTGVAAVALATGLLNAYWMVPALTADNTVLQAISEDDLIAFAPGSQFISPTVSVAALYGFWREGYEYAATVFWPSALLILPIAWFAVYGLVSTYRSRLTLALAFLGALAALLGAGVEGPFRPLFRFFFDNVPLFEGFRDSQKFAGLLALSYAYLGAIGFDHLLARPGLVLKWKRAAVLSASALIVIVPAAYSFTIFWGFSGALGVSYYPREWAEVRSLLNEQAGNTSVLVLPWDTYAEYDWVPNKEKTVRTLARAYFPQTLIYPKHVLNRGGIASQSYAPEQSYMKELMKSAPLRKDFGAQVAKIGAGFVLLAKSSRQVDVFYIYDQDDLELVFDGSTIALFKNRHTVTRLHAAQEGGTAGTELGEAVAFEQNSPVSIRIKGQLDAENYVFFPPNGDITGWRLDGNKPLPGGPEYRGVFPAAERGEFTYLPARRTLLSVAVSLAALGLVAAAAAITWSARRRHATHM